VVDRCAGGVGAGRRPADGVGELAREIGEAAAGQELVDRIGCAGPVGEHQRAGGREDHHAGRQLLEQAAEPGAFAGPALGDGQLHVQAGAVERGRHQRRGAGGERSAARG
jgi:hypothetical protein